jgi:hypothetical protein
MVLFPYLSREIHAVQFLGSNVFITVALGSLAAVLNFYEINHTLFFSHDIDFADFGLPVASNNFKAFLLQPVGDGNFGP